MDEPSTPLRWAYPALAVCADGVWGEKLDGSHSSPLSAFIESSGKGCAACTMILDTIDEFRPGWTSNLVENKGVLLHYGQFDSRPGDWDFSSEALGVHLKLPEHRSQYLAHETSFQLLYQTADEHLFRPNYRGNWTYYGKDLLKSSLHVVQDTRSKAAFDRASRWLSHCVETDDCCKITDSQFKPKRLLYVGSLDDNEPQLQLMEPSDPAVYACLSYCWGTDLAGVLTTTTENLSIHMTHIDETALPKSIADAVFVCRNLGIANLWVDSLCIVQDSPEDWAQQSSVMGEIYAKSHLTIYARNAPSCKSGFLGLQRYGCPSLQRPVRTEVPASLGPLSDSSRLFIRMRSARADEPNFPLDTRGWTMQEALLPNRKLNFNGNEMSWECVGRTICECGHTSDVSILSGPPSNGIKHALGLTHQAHFANGQDHVVTHASILRDWQNVVREYSLRQLTKPDDKLAAISGLASMARDAIAAVAGAEKDKYYAGMWASRLLHDLMWWTPDGGARPPQYRAPTWSWASIDGPVAGFLNASPNNAEFMTNIYRDTEICQVLCRPEDKLNPTGRLADGFLRLKGPVVRLSLPTGRFKEAPRHDNDSLECGVWMDCHDTRATLLEKAIISRCYSRGAEFEARSPKGPTFGGLAKLFRPPTKLEGQPTKPATESSAESAKDQGAEYACIQLITWNCSGKGERIRRPARRLVIGHWTPPVTCFLVLQKQPGQDDIYTRVGVGFCTAVEERDDTPRDNRWEEPKWEFPLFRDSEVMLIKVV